MLDYVVAGQPRSQ